MTQFARLSGYDVVHGLERRCCATALCVAQLALARRALEDALHVTFLTFNLGMPSEKSKTGSQMVGDAGGS